MYGNPSLIVLDEPNASLDQAGEAALMQAVSELKRQGATVIIVTHKFSILAEADQVLVMNGGCVQAFGAAEQVLSQVVGPRPASSLVSAAGPDGAVNRRLPDRQRAAAG